MDPTGEYDFRQLSTTQMRVLGLIAGRRTNRQIATELGLSPATVKWNISQLLSKLGLESRSQAADIWRSRHGLRPVLWREHGRPLQEGSGIPQVAVSSASGIGEFRAAGDSLQIEEWQGSAPGELHVHHDSDIAWHVLEGKLRFRLANGIVEAAAGQTVFIPAGIAHTYGDGDSARYLVIAPPKLFALFHALRAARIGRPHTDWGKGPDSDVYQRFDSELLDIGASAVRTAAR